MTQVACPCPGNICTCSGKPQVKDGATLHVPLMMKDSSMNVPLRDGRPSAGMTLDQAAALPIYNLVRGILTDDGVPMERHMAMLDLERAGDSAQRSEAYRDHMIDEITGRLPNAVNDNATADPQFARDGRAFSELADHERAHERMRRDLADASRH